MITLHKLRHGKHASKNCRSLSLRLERRMLVAVGERCQKSVISHLPMFHGQQELQLYPQKRWMSSQSPKGPQPKRRFYKQVGVTEVNPPWELRFQTKQKKKINDALKAIDSPISAGVDGTQSASGVIGHVTVEDDLSSNVQMEQLKERLIPRCTTITNLTDLMTHPPDQWYSVTLDGKALRTPVGQVLSVPSKLLAWAIAGEWDAQKTQIQPVQMPLMTLTCTALDQTAGHPEHYQQTALQYLPTDTVRAWPILFRLHTSCVAEIANNHCVFAYEYLKDLLLVRSDGE